MASHFRHADERYEVLGDHLVRTVTAPDGRSYAHRCPLDCYREVAYAVGDEPADGSGAGLTMASLAAALGLPFTRANVALEFLKERGVVVTRRRRAYPASPCAFEDAMCEYHALREKPAGADVPAAAD